MATPPTQEPWYRRWLTQLRPKPQTVELGTAVEHDTAGPVQVVTGSAGSAAGMATVTGVGTVTEPKSQRRVHWGPDSTANPKAPESPGNLKLEDGTGDLQLEDGSGNLGLADKAVLAANLIPPPDLNRESQPPNIPPRIGQRVVRNRDRILTEAPAVQEAAQAILQRYEDQIPNDDEQQEFVSRLRDLSKGINDFVAVLETEPAEPEAEAAGQGLLNQFFDFIRAFEATKTGDAVIRLSAGTIILGLTSWFASNVRPDLIFSVLSVAVFHREGKMIADVIKTCITEPFKSRTR